MTPWVMVMGDVIRHLLGVHLRVLSAGCHRTYVCLQANTTKVDSCSARSGIQPKKERLNLEWDGKKEAEPRMERKKWG